jgi:dihydroorotate dehydrogenase
MLKKISIFAIKSRNSFTGCVYRQLFKKLYFRFDPEEVHEHILRFGAALGRSGVLKTCTEIAFSAPRFAILEQNLLGIRFRNPVGLAAGFDKDARLLDILPATGFGFAEVGSVTGEPCGGNPKPRLWRLIKSQALAVNYGLKSEGCQAVSGRLRGKKFQIPIGISIAKTNSPSTVETEDGIEDYAKAIRAFTGIGDYITVNISCPNAFGGLPFTDPGRLDMLLKRLGGLKTPKPIFIKLPPNLSEAETISILDIARGHGIKGFICSNLIKNPDQGMIADAGISFKGGVSGKPLERSANELIKLVYGHTKGECVIAGCGGIFSAEDAYKKIRLGASLVQLITGMIFRGPQLISEINTGLGELLSKDGFKNVSEAVGADYR